MKRAAFFDRDGTINVDTGYLYEPEKLEFIKGAPELIRSYNLEGWMVIVVTNQAGIARGLYDVEQMNLFHRVMNSRLEREYGAHIDAFYFCPHHPDYSGPCECRKPAPGNIIRALSEHDIDPAESVLYGNKASDIAAGVAAGVRSVRISAADGTLHVLG